MLRRKIMETQSPLKSKTIKGGIVTILMSLILLFNNGKPPKAESWETIGQGQDRRVEMGVAIATLMSGVMAIIGRYDAKVPIKRKGEQLE